MPKEQLLGLANDVGRLLAAGSSTAAGHDGLARRARALRELGAKVPTLAAVAAAVERVTAAAPKQAGPAFLDLVVLARQIRGSLSAAGSDGAMAAVPASGPWQTPGSLRDVGPAFEALSHSGEGREEALKDAVGRKVVGDLRLIPALLEGLGDGYAPVADLVADAALPALGQAVLPDLLARLDLQGKAADARALRAVCKIDPARGAELCRQALAEGNTPVKVEALGRLPEVGKPGEAERVGLGLCQAKARDLRVAAIGALRAGKSDEALETLIRLAQDTELHVVLAAEEALTDMPHPGTTARLLRELEAVLAALPPPPKKKAGKMAGARALGRATRGRAPTEAERRLEDAARLMKIVGARKDLRREAAAAVLPLAGHHEAALRLAALRALGKIGPVTEEVLPALLAVLNERDTVLQKYALGALAEIEPAGRAEAVGRVLDLLKAGKLPREVRPHALRLLPPHMDRYGPRILALVAAAIKDKYWAITFAGGDALTAIGPAARSLLPQVLDHLRSGQNYRFADIPVALDPEGEETIPVVVRWLDDKQAKVRVMALQVLTRYGARAAGAAEAVRKRLEESDPFVRGWAVSALGAIQAGQ